MIHAFSIVASRIGAAGYKLMRSSLETWKTSPDPVNKQAIMKRNYGHALTNNPGLTSKASYKRIFIFSYIASAAPPIAEVPH